MPCHNCKSPVTIKAHLIPRVFCKQVQPGTSHASIEARSGRYRISQSGSWDKTILCSTCDNILGINEKYASEVLAALMACPTTPYMHYDVPGIDCNRLIRFFCGILYKYGITEHIDCRLRLGRYLDLCRRAAFGIGSLPDEIDAYIVFPIFEVNAKQRQLAYRTPYPDRNAGLNVHRFMLGGFLVMVKLDRRPFPNGLSRYAMKGSATLCLPVRPFEDLPEFREFRRLLMNNVNLQQYLQEVDTSED